MRRADGPRHFGLDPRLNGAQLSRRLHPDPHHARAVHDLMMAHGDGNKDRPSLWLETLVSNEAIAPRTTAATTSATADLPAFDMPHLAGVRPTATVLPRRRPVKSRL